MSTGDVRNNVRKLQSDLRTIRYHGPVDVYGLSTGAPTTLLPLLHYVLLDYSPLLRAHFSHYQLFGRDTKFLEAVYRLLRDEFNYKPVLSRDQFFSTGYAERKCLFMSDVIGLVRGLNERLAKNVANTTSMEKSCKTATVVRNNKKNTAGPTRVVPKAQPQAHTHALPPPGHVQTHYVTASPSVANAGAVVARAWYELPQENSEHYEQIRQLHQNTHVASSQDEDEYEQDEEHTQQAWVHEIPQHHAHHNHRQTPEVRVHIASSYQEDNDYGSLTMEAGTPCVYDEDEMEVEDPWREEQVQEDEHQDGCRPSEHTSPYRNPSPVPNAHKTRETPDFRPMNAWNDTKNENEPLRRENVQLRSEVAHLTQRLSALESIVGKLVERLSLIETDNHATKSVKHVKQTNVEVQGKTDQIVSESSGVDGTPTSSPARQAPPATEVLDVNPFAVPMKFKFVEDVEEGKSYGTPTGVGEVAQVQDEEVNVEEDVAPKLTEIGVQSPTKTASPSRQPKENNSASPKPIQDNTLTKPTPSTEEYIQSLSERVKRTREFLRGQLGKV